MVQKSSWERKGGDWDILLLQGGCKEAEGEMEVDGCCWLGFGMALEPLVAESASD